MRYVIEGPNHTVNVKFVSTRTIRKHASATATEVMRGLFCQEENLIYLVKGMSPQETMQILLHEAMHAANWQLSGTEDEEAKTDALAAWMIRLFKVTTWESLVCK